MHHLQRHQRQTPDMPKRVISALDRRMRARVGASLRYQTHHVEQRQMLLRLDHSAQPLPLLLGRVNASRVLRACVKDDLQLVS